MVPHIARPISGCGLISRVGNLKKFPNEYFWTTENHRHSFFFTDAVFIFTVQRIFQGFKYALKCGSLKYCMGDWIKNKDPEKMYA